MGQGLEVYSPNGNLIFSSEWGHARVLGSFVAQIATGNRKIISNDGTPIQKVFAYVVPFRAFAAGTTSSRDAVWCVGDTIYWRDLTNPGSTTIVYGDGYA